MIDRVGSPDRGARFLLLSASLVVVVAGLRAAGPLLQPFLLSVFLAIISLPLMAWLQRWRVPTPLAVVATIVTNIAVLFGLLLMLGRSLNQFTAAAPRYTGRLQELFESTLTWLEGRGIQTGGWRALEFVNPDAAMDLLGNTLGAVATLLSNTFLVLLTMMFIMFEAAGFSRKLRAAFGESDHLERLARMAVQIQRYLAIKTLISFATGLLVGAWVAVTGIGSPLLWGVVAFLLNYIPNLGSILAAAPPVLVALVQFGAGRAVVVAIGYLAINVVLANVTEPYLMGRRLGLSTLVVLMSLVFWGWVWGPVGMLLSVPLTMVIKIALENTQDLRWIAVMLDANPPLPRESAPP